MPVIDERTMGKIGRAVQRSAETETTQKNYEVTPEQAKRMLRRYAVMPGRFMIVREVHAQVLSRLHNEAGKVVGMEGDETRKGIQALFGGWGVVLMVGDPYLLDSGKLLLPHPELVPGARVLVGRTPPEELDLAVGGGQVTVGLSNFREVTLIDRGAEVEEEVHEADKVTRWTCCREESPWFPSKAEAKDNHSALHGPTGRNLKCGPRYEEAT